MFCFLIPKISRNKPPKNFGLFTNTTFITKITSTFRSRATENDHPYRQNCNKYPRRKNTARHESHRKGYRNYTLASSSAHLDPSVITIIAQKKIFVTKILLNCDLKGFYYIKRFDDICRRIVTCFTLNGQKSVKADFL